MQKTSEEEQEAKQAEFLVRYMMRGPVLDWGLMEAEPGKTMGAHWHEEVEETFYCITGNGAFYVNDEEFPFNAGDAIRCEPGEKHDIANTGSEPMKILFVKTPYLPDDKHTE
jgi:mannose-6-phosphate isomerase-like protein (cupin superfamily)